MRRFSLNFSTPIEEYQKKLKEKYKWDYNLDSIETVLNKFQDNYYHELYLLERESIVLIKEDFQLKQLITV